jgi:CubicO group peptidase (beta-lactamase class C family)
MTGVRIYNPQQFRSTIPVVTACPGFGMKRLPMKNWIRTCLIIVLIGTVRAAPAASPMARGAPEAQGVSSAALLDFVTTLDQQIDGLHSLMVVRHGSVIAEGWWSPYDAEHNHVLYSLSKSFTSTAVGCAVAEGKLSLDDEVLKFFPTDAPTNASNNLKAMRVRDLLMMSTGQQAEPPTAPDEVSAKSFLAQAVPHLPGTHFKYNTAATFMLSAIVQKVTGQTVLEFLRPHLFEPLGIEHPVWDANFQGISLGGYGLRVRTEDIAKFGQLYLQRGQWKGKQLLPEEWVALATAKQTANGSNPQSDWNQGYGFQFWRCRHNAFRGDGAFGQFCVVLPEQDTVVAITSGVKDMQALLNVIWDKLLPALQPQELPANPASAQQLRDKLARLEVRTAQGSATSSLAGKVLNRKFGFSANDQKLESLTLASSDSGKTLTLAIRMDGQETPIPCGFQEWKLGRAPLMGSRLAQFPDEPTAGTFAWSTDDTCVIKQCAYETPYHTTLTLKFNGEQMTLDSEANVAFGPTQRPPLSGRME